MEERYLTVTALTKYIKYKFDHDHHLDEVYEAIGEFLKKLS